MAPWACRAPPRRAPGRGQGGRRARAPPVRASAPDSPADRAWQALYGHTAYNGFPRHVRSVDVGLVRASGELVSAGDAVEFFQLVEKADGAPYWLDLERMLEAPARPLDVERARELARVLADSHPAQRS